MLVLPPTVGANADRPLLPVIEQEAAVLDKYGAISARVAQTLAGNAAEQWSARIFWLGVALGAGGVLGLQLFGTWLGTSLVGVVKDATTDPSAIAEKVVNKLQGTSAKKSKK